MGLSTRIITSDFPVEMQVDERLYSIDRDKGLFAAPRAHMLLFFLDVDHEIEVAGEEGVWLLRPNDACLLPSEWARTYRPRQEGRASRMHVLRVIWHFAEDLGLLSVKDGVVLERRKAEQEMRKERWFAEQQNWAAVPRVSKRRFIAINECTQDERDWILQYQTPSDFSFEFGPDGLDFLREFTRKPRYIPGVVTPAVHELIREVRNEFDQRPPGYKLRITSMMLGLSVLCARAVMRTGATGERREMPAQSSVTRGELIVRRTKEFLFENHRRSLTLDEVARHLRLSPGHVSRAFRQMTGKTVFDYLRFVRVDIAQQLLADSSRTVADVGRSVGFSTPTLFGRAFKRETGVTPQTYRQRILSETYFGPSTQV
ncbi:helix-turn-helix transcriptional regulator [Geminisphaera colitermitum]|uniref:helix-turn-helix transcriptional regulator n=1 Tax=Geminisphaera colitermitum TaxID=1148786 RepID=UPI000158D611|nr:AraC family transcriptional regulator [Geminisphaera colitermitum]